MQSPAIERITTAQWVAIDGVTALALLAGSTALTRAAAGPQGPSWALWFALAAASAAGALRRRRPLVALGLAVLAGPVAMGAGAFPAPWVVTAFVMYAVPSRFPRRAALHVLAGTLLLCAAGLVVAPLARPGPNRLGSLLEGALLVSIAWAVGYAVQQQRLHTAQQAQRRLTEERLRIARELHDVVAHSMSVIALQAGVANHVSAQRPEEARRALSSIEEVSRAALQEMRALLGVLRAPDEPVRPAPGLADVPALVSQAADAGVHVELEVTGEQAGLPELPDGVDLAAYRVVQEAVTNVIKHAATDRCQVRIERSPSTVTVRVTDRGRGGTAAAAGHGITGMRERARMYGGTLDAGPPPDQRGFQITATFPVPQPEHA
ncbi:sensor histidine kinase [Dactylosporangium sp. AC04546]|uniref:sensor histidine kinase n=1 Tax=Dactylosporangium sp. AC04546 TaxID=2862460 RepID=UPI001EE0A16F|nr:sensor histidine kinase [Dactylosporangium sp. AC04546]WVK79463.1 sensor histidine kinase [Dactylosporangium sp. AC04546]